MGMNRVGPYGASRDPSVNVLTDGRFDGLVSLVRRALDVPDVSDMLTETSRRAVELLDARAAGVLIRAGDGRLHLAGTSTLDPAVLGAFRSATVDALVDRALVQSDPAFDQQDGVAFHAFPMRAGDHGVGALGVLSERALPAPQGRLAGLLADLAALVVLQADAVRDEPAAVARAHRLLEQRALLGRAVGMLAQRFTVGPDEALRRLRTAAQEGGLTPVEVARDIVARRSPLPGALDGDGPGAAD